MPNPENDDPLLPEQDNSIFRHLKPKPLTAEQYARLRYGTWSEKQPPSYSEPENITIVVHIATCAQLQKVPCPAGKSLHEEGTTEHWWSGWPGAYCMKCGAEDKDEICLADSCQCPCHKDEL